MGLSSNGIAGLKAGVVDSVATRPTSPFEGQIIFQKDTDEVLAYDGTSWTRPKNMPWGVVAYNQSTTAMGNFSTETVAITGSSFTAVANRYYKVTYFEPDPYSVTSTGYYGMAIRITNISGAIKNIGYTNFVSPALNNAMGSVYWVGTLPAGATNFVGTLGTNTGTMSSNRGSSIIAYLFVEDIGPA